MIGLPELDELLVAHNCLHATSIQLNVDGIAYDLFLSISASEKVGADVVSIRFIDISQSKGPDLIGKQPGAILQQQSDNRISDLASQYNNSSLQPKDF